MSSPYRMGPVVRSHALGTLREARDLDGACYHALEIAAEHLATATTRAAVLEWATQLSAMKPHERVQHRVDLVDRDTSLTVVLRFVEGPPPGRPARASVESMLCSVALGLAHAHRAGVFHGALTSACLPCPGGQPIVTDFGASRLARSLHPTRAGGYDARECHALAPEELRVRDARPSAAADVYALGVLAYEWLEGRVPFSGHVSMGEIITATLRGDVPPMCEGDPSLVRIVSSMLDQDPSARPSAADVAAMLSLEWPLPVPI